MLLVLYSPPPDSSEPNFPLLSQKPPFMSEDATFLSKGSEAAPLILSNLVSSQCFRACSEVVEFKLCTILNIYYFYVVLKCGYLEMVSNFSTASLFLNLEQKAQELHIISRIMRVLFKIKESLSTISLIQCYKTRMTNSSKLLALGYSSKFLTRSLLKILLSTTHKF